MTPITPAVLDQVFRSARTFNAFSGKEVPDALLRELYDLLKWGPTSMNCQPARYVFVRSDEAKDRLAPALSAGNVAKTMAAPVTVIVAMDSRFYEHLPTQFPSNPKGAETFSSKPVLAESTAFRNGTLQGAYLIIAARLLGLDCGPMSGFDAAKVNAEFFPDGRYQANFLVNLGYGDPSGNHPRGPRLDFETVAQIL
ncbi:malonic semialdehyde reductase [Denitromonas iodatirespirans]|uniref:Putative NADH dehydrogenase/NAD(P)H nitroreductase I8J34_22155 n=1 Tax=Denitromonas iodatirespirans TaxID=2795389 RepID=A0A944DF14_DENI1|nr:malonic semialdehyde reductase [Denitromonas iodatirespirans]MBT0963891.1 malonic semialdehyde reductase [Denitromonas iodatirespirans]